MYNPLMVLTEDILTALILNKYLYFVRQTYPRGIVKGVHEAFLITPYATWQEATEHYNLIRFDKRKYVYNIDCSKGDHLSRGFDREKLYIAAKQPAGYRIYVNQMDHKPGEWYPPRGLVMQMHDHVKMLGWGSRNMKIDTMLILHFGQLVVKFRNKGHTEEITLDDLEKY